MGINFKQLQIMRFALALATIAVAVTAGGNVEPTSEPTGNDAAAAAAVNTAGPTVDPFYKSLDSKAQFDKYRATYAAGMKIANDKRIFRKAAIDAWFNAKDLKAKRRMEATKASNKAA